MAAQGDNPIKNASQDALGRAQPARSIAAEVRDADASEGCVFAIIGPWGSGKTSLINLVRERLDDDPAIPVLEFNPWMFSGPEQLVDSFFRELAAQLRLKDDKLGKVAKEIEAYGKLFSPLAIIPVVGPILAKITGAASSVKKFQEDRKQSVTARRKKLAAELAKLEQRIVVVVDDIDRLQTNEIRDIFKLVRLTASFPNIVYVLAFDRVRVEQALTDDGLEGRSYMEKIVQIAVDLPAASENLLLNQLAQALDSAIGDVVADPLFDTARWTDVLVEIVIPLVHNMRDVRRYAASVRGTIRVLNGQVELVDVLALEAVRIFMPDLFKALVQARQPLTRAEPTWGGARPNVNPAITQMLEVATESPDIARSIIKRLFPVGGRFLGEARYGTDYSKSWLKARRVAHPDVFALYLEWTIGENMAAFMTAETAFSMFADEAALIEFMDSIAPEKRADVIAALENFEGSYPVEAVGIAASVLINLLPTLPKREQGLFTPDTHIIVTRVVLRLFQRLPGPTEVEQAVTEILPKLRDLSCRFELVRLVGYIEGAGHKLASEEFAASIEHDLRQSVFGASSDALSAEWDLLTLLYWAYRRGPDEPTTFELVDDPAVSSRVLSDARSEVRRQSMDSRSVQREERLAWETLVEVYGSESQLSKVVAAAEQISDDDAELAKTIKLAKKYLSGWRPSSF